MWFGVFTSDSTTTFEGAQESTHQILRGYTYFNSVDDTHVIDSNLTGGLWTCALKKLAFLQIFLIIQLGFNNFPFLSLPDIAHKRKQTNQKTQRNLGPTTFKC